jgi:hypothetical protein
LDDSAIGLAQLGQKRAPAGTGLPQFAQKDTLQLSDQSSEVAMAPPFHVLSALHADTSVSAASSLHDAVSDVGHGRGVDGSLDFQIALLVAELIEQPIAERLLYCPVRAGDETV